VKLSGIGASVAQDLEPECVTFSVAGNIAFVALQVGGGLLNNILLNKYKEIIIIE
jgi:hypothetical protein